MSRLFAIAILAAVAGCASKPPQPPMVWDKPGGDQQEFAQVKFDCLKQSQYRDESLYVGGAMADASSTIRTNFTLFSACMNAHGWYRVPAD